MGFSVDCSELMIQPLVRFHQEKSPLYPIRLYLSCLSTLSVIIKLALKVVLLTKSFNSVHIVHYLTESYIANSILTD